MTKVSVILPTYNEKENIIKLIKWITKILKKDFEIIVADDDSPDLTWKRVEDLKLPNVKVIRRFKNKGVGASISDGIKKAKGDIIVWMDADLTHPATLIPEMISLVGKYDVVVASRYVRGGKDKRSFLRVLTSKMINGFANLVLEYKVLDYDSGFVVAKREVTDAVPFNTEGHGEYCIEFLYKAAKKGYKIKEVGYVFTERLKGESKTSFYVYSIFLHGFKYIKRILDIRFKDK